MLFLPLVNTYQSILQKGLPKRGVLFFIILVVAIPGLVRSDTATIAVKLTIHPRINAFIQKAGGGIEQPLVRTGLVGNNLSSVQLCVTRQGVSGFDVFIGKEQKQRLIHSDKSAHKGCYYPFSQVTKKEIHQASDRLSQQILLTISPL